MWFVSDGNRTSWENEWSGPPHPAASQRRGQGSKASRIKSQATQKEWGFHQIRPNVTGIVRGCLVSMWINTSVVSVLHPSETFLCCQLYLKRKREREREREKRRKTKHPQMVMIIEAMVKYLSSLGPTLFWLNLRFFQDHSPNMCPQFWSFHRWRERKREKRTTTTTKNSKHYLLSQQSSMV